MNKIKDQKISKFLDGVASKSPTPGGGAVAAIAGAMAASLVEMVCALTIGKKGYEKHTKALEEDLKIAKKDTAVLLELADSDVSAFDSVMAAYKSKDKSKIGSSLKLAMDIPAKVVGYCMEIESIALELTKIGNKNAISDAQTAQALAKAAIAGATANVKINADALAKL
jgi:formiminotetrahydrofolate cyclodeaminase